jgi:hypothetical protein
MNHDQSHTPKPVTATCTPRRGLVTLLRSVAGAPAGWRPSRRGSFLVLVVGTLALLAVMAVVYTTIGNHDARMTHASDKREKLDDVPQQVADYIARLIGEDTLSVGYSSRRLVDVNSGGIPLERKTFDYPYTSWAARSDALVSTGGNTPVYPFSPTGSVAGFLTTPDQTANNPLYANVFTPGTMPRTWEHTSPYLAATEPTYLNYGSAAPRTGGRDYLDVRDWAHISNIAPDGRFVNLWNLRGNWDKPSLFGAIAWMSQNLGLYDGTGRMQVTNPQTDFGLSVTGALRLHPAYFDSRQQWLFRPACPTAGATNGPSSQTFDPYQFADADGDGMYDSRWQELSDLRSLAALLGGNNNGAITSILHTDGKIRYFVAARIIDASSMVNVNRAADMHAAPADMNTAPLAYMPAGVTPAEIDLQGILRMRGSYAINGMAYDGLYQPNGLVPGNYAAMNSDTGYDITRAQIVGDFAYASLRLALAGGAIPSIDYRGFGSASFKLTTDFPATFNLSTGSPALLSWDNLTATDYTNTPYLGFLNPGLRAQYYGSRAALYDDTAFQGGVTGSPGATSTFTGSFGLDDMLELFGRRTVNNPLYTSPLEATLDGRDDTTTNTFPNTMRFGVLRSNRPLEVEHDLRYRFPLTGSPATVVGSPYDITMLHFASDVRQRVTTISGGRDFTLAPGVLGVPEAASSNKFFAGVSSDTLDQGELRVDPRVAMKDVHDADLSSANPVPLLTLKKKSEAINTIFQAYANALLPTSGIRDPVLGSPWNNTSSGFANRMTEFYGYQGPELALHVAAHMAANFMDMYDDKIKDPINGGDKPDVPTVHTLLLNSAAQASLSTLNNPPPYPTGVPAYPTWDQTFYPLGDKHNLMPLQLPDQRLGDANQGDTVTAPAVNIYGVEPQPFLTQVAAFTVYGDNAQIRNPTTEIEIDGSVSFATNHDVMYRVVAFQLTNPFGVPVTVGGAATFKAAPATPPIPDVSTSNFDVMDARYPRPDREANFYYIKFGDKYFKLAAMDEAVYVDQNEAATDLAQGKPAIASTTFPPRSIYIQNGVTAEQMLHMNPITIPAGKSVVCYALSDIPRNILKRRLGNLSTSMNPTEDSSFFNIVIPTLGVSQQEVRTTLELAIERQLNGDNPSDVSGVFWIPQIDADPTNPAASGQVILPDSTNLFPATGASVVELWRSARYGAEAIPQTVQLPGTGWDGTTPTPAVISPKLPPPNDFRNDQLIDRMRIPSNASFADLNTASKLHDGPNRIGGSDSHNNDPRFLYMLETHASVRRKSDPRLPNNAKPPLGAIPGYCIEPKYSTDWNLTQSSSDLATLNESDFTFSTQTFADFKGCARTPASWVGAMRRGHLNKYLDYHMWQAPGSYTDNATNGVVIPIDPDGTGVALGTGPTPYSDHYPQITIANNNFQTLPTITSPPPGYQPIVSTLRPADMLLPLGIGPEEMPYYYAPGTSTLTPVTDNEVRWTTLGEALALVMGYQTNSAPAGTPDSVYVLTSGNSRQVLDRGNLRLDDYIPFIGDGSVPPTFDPNTCERVGNQIPLALNVLDTFTVLPSHDIMNSSNQPILDFAIQTLTRGTSGRVNINTIPLNTLRPGFGLLSPPPPDDLPSAGRPSQPWWWWSGADAVTTGMPLLDERVDIAPTVIAYRDKGTQFLRPGSEVGPPASPTSINYVYFTDTTATPDQPAGQDGRTSVTHIGQPPSGTAVPSSPLHEQPGFRTIGELMNVRYRDNSPVIPPPSLSYKCNMDWLANDNLTAAPGAPTTSPATTYADGASGHVGLDSVLFDVGGVKTPSAVKNNYTEQLEIINGVLNSVSSRSDVFVAWFQIQGYKQSDVENLGDDDPMTPSVNRRFVMVIDRSKVTRRGQAADILLFKEVPVDPEPKSPVP